MERDRQTAAVPRDRGALRRPALLAAEVLLVLIIIGLLVAMWLPAWIGGRPGVGHF